MIEVWLVFGALVFLNTLPFIGYDQKTPEPQPSAICSSETCDAKKVVKDTP